MSTQPMSAEEIKEASKTCTVSYRMRGYFYPITKTAISKLTGRYAVELWEEEVMIHRKLKKVHNLKWINRKLRENPSQLPRPN